MRQKERERLEAIERLKTFIKPGDILHTKVTHVSRSGMMRLISVYKIENNQPRNISYLAARILDWGEKDDAVKVSGCGMDMGFHLVYSISSALFPDGFTCIGEDPKKHWTKNCPSNDHVNGDRNYKPHNHPDGGYALRHEWL